MLNYYDELGIDSKLSNSDIVGVMTDMLSHWTAQTQSENLSERIESEKMLPLNRLLMRRLVY